VPFGRSGLICIRILVVRGISSSVLLLTFLAGPDQTSCTLYLTTWDGLM